MDGGSEWLPGGDLVTHCRLGELKSQLLPSPSPWPEQRLRQDHGQEDTRRARLPQQSRHQRSSFIQTPLTVPAWRAFPSLLVLASLRSPLHDPLRRLAQ